MKLVVKATIVAIFGMLPFSMQAQSEDCSVLRLDKTYTSAIPQIADFGQLKSDVQGPLRPPFQDYGNKPNGEKKGAYKLSSDLLPPLECSFEMATSAGLSIRCMKLNFADFNEISPIAEELVTCALQNGWDMLPEKDGKIVFQRKSGKKPDELSIAMYGPAMFVQLNQKSE